jgi:aminoglycoside phosphotransferase (APT) family kinase protein
MSRSWDAEIPLTPDMARAALRRGAPALAHESLTVAGEGWDNLVFRVGLGHALRLPRRQLAADLLAGEVDFLRAWAPALPLPVPQVVARIPPGDGYPHESVLVTWVAGGTGCIERSDDQRAACAPALGCFLRALHALPPILPDGSMPRGDTLRRAEVPHRAALIRSWLEALMVEAPDLDLAPAVPLLEALATTPQWPHPPRWVHGDLYGRHLMIAGDALCGIIDWGDVHLGDPAIDLSIVRSWLPEVGRDAFWAAYGEVDAATWARARLRTLHYAVALWRYARNTGDAGMERLAARAWAAALREDVRDPREAPDGAGLG